MTNIQGDHFVDAEQNWSSANLEKKRSFSNHSFFDGFGTLSTRKRTI